MSLALTLALLAAPLSGVDEVPLAAPTDGVVRYVVAVGYNGRGEGGRRSLRFSDDDAARFYLQLLPSAKRGWLLASFDEESARAFVDLTDIARPPSQAELARVLGELTWSMREDRRRGLETELVFYFAGHGDVDAGGEGYLVLADGPFTRTDLETQVVGGSLADTNHVVVDACASYFMVARGDEKSGKKPLSPDLLDVLSSPSPKTQEAYLRTGVLVSTSDAAEVHESAELGGGVFSYLLRSALAGGADVDADGDVEYAEAASFIASASAAIEDPRARLKAYAKAPVQRPHVALVDFKSTDVQHFLAVEGGVSRRVQLLDARGVPYAEVHAGKHPGVRLALVGNPFFIVRVGSKEAVLVPRRAGAYSLSSLDFQDALEARGHVDGTFAGLFRAAFDRSFVEGYVAHSALLPPRADGSYLVAYAPGAEAPFELPLGALGMGSLVGAGVLATATVGAAVGNAVAYAELEKGYRDSRYLDPDLSLAVEGWRTAALASVAGTVAFGVTGALLITLEVLKEPQEDAP